MTYQEFRKNYIVTFWRMMHGRQELIPYMAALSDQYPTEAERVEDEIELMTNSRLREEAFR